VALPLYEKRNQPLVDIIVISPDALLDQQSAIGQVVQVFRGGGARYAQLLLHIFYAGIRMTKQVIQQVLRVNPIVIRPDPLLVFGHQTAHAFDRRQSGLRRFGNTLQYLEQPRHYDAQRWPVRRFQRSDDPQQHRRGVLLDLQAWDEEYLPTLWRAASAPLPRRVRFPLHNRTKLGVDDKTRADRALMGIVGKRLTYQTTGGRA
jgi:hypothetical protein